MGLTAAADLWEVIAVEAGQESRLWKEALRPLGLQERERVFSTLGEEHYALGIETIYEGYLLHYGRPRLFSPATADAALLLGDYLYAHGLVRIAEVGRVEAVADLAELISLCAQLRADGTGGDGAAWAATAATLGGGALDAPRRDLRDRGDAAALVRVAEEAGPPGAVERALSAHSKRVG